MGDYTRYVLILKNSAGRIVGFASEHDPAACLEDSPVAKLDNRPGMPMADQGALCGSRCRHLCSHLRLRIFLMYDV